MGLDTARSFCLALMALGALAILTGFVAPFWLTASFTSPTESRDEQYGLWFFCVSSSVRLLSKSSSSSSCETVEWGGDYPAVFYVVHILAVLASLLGVVTLFRSLCSLCGKGQGIIGIAVMGMIGGFLGLLAAGVFTGNPYDSLAFKGSSLVKDWAFILFFAGSGIVSFFSILLVFLQRLLKDDTVISY